MMLPPPSPAEIQRRSLWEMPKDTLPMKREKQVRYVDKDGIGKRLNLVMLKGRGYMNVLQRSTKVIAQAAVKQGKLYRMYREGMGPNWTANDVPEQRTRGGWRAYRVRSGMRDQRYDPEYRLEEKRIPDSRRKRFRWGQQKSRSWIWRGRGKKPKRW